MVTDRRIGRPRSGKGVAAKEITSLLVHGEIRGDRLHFPTLGEIAESCCVSVGCVSYYVKKYKTAEARMRYVGELMATNPGILSEAVKRSYLRGRGGNAAITGRKPMLPPGKEEVGLDSMPHGDGDGDLFADPADPADADRLTPDTTPTPTPTRQPGSPRPEGEGTVGSVLGRDEAAFEDGGLDELSPPVEVDPWDVAEVAVEAQKEVLERPRLDSEKPPAAASIDALAAYTSRPGPRPATEEVKDEIERLLVYGEKVPDASGEMVWRYLTQREVAERIGCHLTTVNKISQVRGLINRQLEVQKQRLDQAVDEIVGKDSPHSSLPVETRLAIVDRWIFRFARSLEQGSVDTTQPIDFERMLRLRAFLEGSAESTKHVKHTYTIENLTDRYGKLRAKEQVIDAVLGGMDPVGAEVPLLGPTTVDEE